MIRFLPIYLLFILMLGASCRELVTLDLPQQEPRLIVEGHVTDTQGPHTVKLSLSQDYFSTTPAQVVEDAVVRISDDAGNSEVLLYTGSGVYATQALQGVVGRSYSLEIDWRGEHYTSSGTLMPKGIVDSLSVAYYEAIPPVFDAGYYLTFYGKIPPEAADFYRVQVYENDSLYNDRTDLLIPDSRFVPSTIVEQLQYPFEIGDTVRLELYSLDRNMYDYYVELRSLLFNDGGLFSPPPRNPTSNIINVSNPDNQPLGFFQVASFDTGTIIIEEEPE
ncbi:DUF4249 domain-containing protein [Cesiribacter sp. SM1]|uniref:DUF4249 domain-containing protein n=1 Tax=Cesiribacter sp. SM1 TaxID=2861196 RepID=UPI001CD4868B|nr:DUF4249 domain-containing protein [Cesiribacter sp. SM1]